MGVFKPKNHHSLHIVHVRFKYLMFVVIFMLISILKVKHVTLDTLAHCLFVVSGKKGGITVLPDEPLNTLSLRSLYFPAF